MRCDPPLFYISIIYKFAPRTFLSFKIFKKEDFFMSSRTKRFKFFLSLTFGIFFFSLVAQSQSGVTLYTPYTNISVPPGESVNYTIDVINNGKTVKNFGISVAGIPKTWSYTLKLGGYAVSQVSVLPGDKKSLDLRVEIPLQVNKGNYRFSVVGNGVGTLPLVVNVNKEGTYKTEFSCNQPNMQGHSKSTFTYNASLKNSTAEKQLYSLTTNTPPGWEVVFKANYKQVTSVEIEPNANSDISIEVNPPDNIEAGTYVVPVKASTSSTSANLDLQVVVSGSYNIELSTPTGLLSAKVTAGQTKKIELTVLNTGSSVLSNVELSSSAPSNWEITLEPSKIDNIMAGKSAQVIATIKADKRAIPGDYQVAVNAKTNEVSARADIRVIVRTPLFWGWVGIFVIMFAIGIVYYLFRKYGRR
jgi:uncharacterized membrane protein